MKIKNNQKITAYSRQYLRSKVVETPTAWITVAVLIEETGLETFVSSPKIIKVVPKKGSALASGVQKQTLCLCPGKITPTKVARFFTTTPSPYFETDAKLSINLFARPPTFSL